MKKKNLPIVSHIISYVPLLRPQKSFLSDPKELNDVMLKSEMIPAHAKASLWAMEEDIPTVYMIMDKAKEIADHLKEWSEDKPEKWFTFGILGKDERYAFALMPDVEQSVKRIRLAYQLQNGWPMPDNAKFQVFFAPLSFVSMTRGAYDTLEGEIHRIKKVKTYLVQFDEKLKQMDQQAMTEYAINNRNLLGTFSTETPDANYGYIDQMFQE